MQWEHMEGQLAQPGGDQERLLKAGDTWAESQGVSEKFPRKKERVFQVEGMAKVKEQG